MTVPDDMRRLAQEDVVYLTRLIDNPDQRGQVGVTEVLRGRVRQALSGNWVFNSFLGQNGMVGIVLGQIGNSWSSVETPAAGIQVTIPTVLINQPPQMLRELVVLMTVIPEDFAT